MTDPLLAALFTLIAATAAAAVAALATRVQVLPEVIDLSIIPTSAGVFSLTFTFIGALRRYESDRIGRLALLGNLVGGLAAALGVLIAILVDVLS